jgi:hypothetical protein
MSLTLGFQDDGRLRDKQDFTALDQGKALGGSALRLIVSRERVQRPDGSYDFSLFDNIVNQARARGIHPQIVLDNQEGFKPGSGDPKKYENFVKAAGVHFKGRVGTYSFINEPDLKMNPQKYRELFIRGQRALGGVDNKAQVLFGELSPHGGMDYAKKVIGKKGITASGFAMHPYQTTDPLAAPDRPDQKWGIGRSRTMQRMLSGMNIRTRANKTPGMYYTEFGYQVNNPQATNYWPRAFQAAKRAGIRELVAYTMTGAPNPNPTWDSGLLNPDGTPRPTYNAVQASARSLR